VKDIDNKITKFLNIIGIINNAFKPKSKKVKAAKQSLYTP
jgi:hypothetical protein